MLDIAGRADFKLHDQGPMKGVVTAAKLIDQLPNPLIDGFGRKRALDDRARLANMTVKDEAALKRIHRAVNPLHRVRNTVVEQSEAIEPRRDQIEKISTGGGAVER